VKCLVNHLKLWADPWYNHPADVKYSGTRLTYDSFIVTSNYSIEELDLSEVDRAALKRRFKVTEFKQLN